jgi:hypothetical protein
VHWLEPSLDENCPAGHGIHTEELASEYVPSGHGVQSVAADFENVPALQLSQYSISSSFE